MYSVLLSEVSFRLRKITQSKRLETTAKDVGIGVPIGGITAAIVHR
jgi:hypothetical protein